MTTLVDHMVPPMEASFPIICPVDHAFVVPPFVYCNAGAASDHPQCHPAPDGSTLHCNQCYLYVSCLPNWLDLPQRAEPELVPEPAVGLALVCALAFLGLLRWARMKGPRWHS